MLINDLYHIQSAKKEADGQWIFELVFHEDNPIFKAHFPGNPIVPGACIIQVVKELYQNATGLDLEIKRVRNVKFKNIIHPGNPAVVTFSLSYAPLADGMLELKADVSHKDMVFNKMSLEAVNL